MNSFEDLEVWKQCRLYRMQIYTLTLTFPSDEKYRIVDQLKRASRSVTANIAKGHGRFHYLDNIRFCRNARGSLNETMDHLICAADESMINNNELENLRALYDQCFKLLNGYIAYLKKRADDQKLV